MISYQEATELLEMAALARHLSSESILLEETRGRVSSKSVCSPAAVPSFDNSAMDGFAVRAETVAGASQAHPVRLPVLGTVFAGESESRIEASGTWEIMTGATIPPGGFDAVIKVEDVQVQRDDKGRAFEIIVDRPVSPRQFVRLRGADFQIGKEVLAGGTLITPEIQLALAVLGIDRLEVWLRPKVAVLSTGEELVSHDVKDVPPGKIRNGTAPFLLSALEAFGCECHYHGIIPDVPGKFVHAMEELLSSGPDIVVTTGAVSMGRRDFIKETLVQLGAGCLFHRVAVQPGKPILFAEFKERVNRPVIFGLPGNPISTVVGFRFFIVPYLRKLLGMPSECGMRMPLVGPVKKTKGLQTFLRGTVGEVQGVCVDVPPAQASFKVSTLTQTNAWAVLPEEVEEAPAGTLVDVFLGPVSCSG